ncbi:MAG: tetratricopeptide repeat protein, partial [Planctomycetota bacterium]
EIGDRRSEASATGNLARVFSTQGRYEEARAHYEKWLALARKIGSAREEGYALDGLASLAEREGDLGEAARLYEECLKLRRELGEKANVAETLVGLARIEAGRGEAETTRTRLEEALTLAEETKTPGTILSATVERARLPGGDLEAALTALEEHESRVGLDRRLEAHFRLWELTKDRSHLAEAKRLLDFAVEHSAEEYRETMIENVPLHREIMKAWEEHGTKE